MASAEGNREEMTRLGLFLKSVGYPERAPDGASAFTLRVDGMEVVAEERDGRVVLSYAVSDDDSLLPSLARYSAGRMLREDAALTWDNGAFLWQDVPADASQAEMARVFERFMDSCDWWRERVDALHGGKASADAAPESMMIRP